MGFNVNFSLDNALLLIYSHVSLKYSNFNVNNNDTNTEVVFTRLNTQDQSVLVPVLT